MPIMLHSTGWAAAVLQVRTVLAVHRIHTAVAVAAPRAAIQIEQIKYGRSLSAAPVFAHTYAIVAENILYEGHVRVLQTVFGQALFHNSGYACIFSADEHRAFHALADAHSRKC